MSAATDTHTVWCPVPAGSPAFPGRRMASGAAETTTSPVRWCRRVCEQCSQKVPVTPSAHAVCSCKLTPTVTEPGCCWGAQQRPPALALGWGPPRRAGSPSEQTPPVQRLWACSTEAQGSPVGQGGLARSSPRSGSLWPPSLFGTWVCSKRR